MGWVDRGITASAHGIDVGVGQTQVFRLTGSDRGVSMDCKDPERRGTSQLRTLSGLMMGGGMEMDDRDR